jgi:hypothetical protein
LHIKISQFTRTWKRASNHNHNQTPPIGLNWSEADGEWVTYSGSRLDTPSFCLPLSDSHEHGNVPQSQSGSFN